MLSDKKKEVRESLAFIDLAEQQKRIRSQIEQRMIGVLDHGKYILGPEVAEFEQRLAAFVGVRHCIGVSSGTDALLMALMAWGVGPGDAVFTTPFTFIATAEVISLLGATPVFVDIDPATYNIDPDQLELAVKAVNDIDGTLYPLPRLNNGQPLRLTPKAIIPVDLFGLPADYDSIMEVAELNNMYVLEDAAQGLGGVYHGRQAGSLGHIGTTSFFPAKPLGCYGDGGAVFTDSDEYAEIIKSIRVHGKGGDKYDNIRVGLNARLHTLQAAILLEKLNIFPQEIQERQRIASQYCSLLSQCEKIVIPTVPTGLQSVWAQFSLLSEKRQSMQDILKEMGIPTAVYYGCPLHQQPAYKDLGYQVGDMPVSEVISRQVFSIPMHPYLTNTDIKHIAAEIISAAKQS
jgi:UDP-2-acetamido-2-deoxy-ribo-hexuluronate aminotransferase